MATQTLITHTSAATPQSTSSTTTTSAPTSIEAKLVILGAQGVGKTSLVQRFLNPPSPNTHSHSSPLPQPPSTVGASFSTRLLTDADTSTTVRLQIWDTAGQERFRSISRLYYRGANAGVLCYDVTSQQSWEEMKGWLRELREYGGEEVVVHVVGTKSDIVAEFPERREVNFEKTISFVAEEWGGLNSKGGGGSEGGVSTPGGGAGIQSVDSKRSSGFWNQDVGWDSCHEVNAKDGEGIEEVFRVIARKLVEQRSRKEEAENARLGRTPGWRSDDGEDYFAGPHGSQGSFRLGHGDKRRSWLGLPGVGVGLGIVEGAGTEDVRYTRDNEVARKRGRCC